MKTWIKRENILKAIIVLTVVNLVILMTTIFYTVRPERTDRERRSENYIKEQLKLTDDQEADFEKLRENFRFEMQTLKKEMRRDSQLWREELSKENPNTDRLDSLALEMGVKDAKFRKLSYRHYMQMKEIIGPNQQEELKRMYRGMFREDRGMRHRGQGRGKMRDNNDRKNRE
jgi:Spy/CpxP family protein refolding chaperone